MKIYKQPQIQIIEVKEQDLICTSTLDVTVTGNDGTGGGSRQARQRSSIWSDYDEE